MVRSAIAVAATLCGLAAGLPCQVQPGSQQQSPTGEQLLQSGGRQGPRGEQISEFSSIWSKPVAPKFEGFPAFSPGISGYGNYPLPVDPSATGLQPALGANTPLALPLAPAMPEPVGWPTWIRTQAKRPLPFAPDVGLLVSESGRVWHRDSNSDPFVPLFSHDQFASLPAGGEVEMRRSGAFEMLFHQSTRVQTRGATTVRAIALDEESVHLEFSTVTWLRIEATRREHRIGLPDGSTLVFAAIEIPALGDGVGPGLTPSPGTGAASNPLAQALFGIAAPIDIPRPPRIEIRRADEPGYYGGRATITNLGGADVTWHHAFGTTTIQPSQRVTFFLTRPTSNAPAGLDKGDSRIDGEGRTAADASVITCTATRDTEVRWCGASVNVPSGAKVTLDALGGAVIATQPPPRPPAAAGSAKPSGS